MKLCKKQEQILEVLADERARNPQTSLTGLDMKLLGEKVGAYRGIGVMYDVQKLTYAGFVSRKGNKVIITQKGLDYVKSHSLQRSFQKSLTPHSLKSWVFITLIVSIVAGLIVAAITGWRPW